MSEMTSTTVAPALAAWESATVQNLLPVLSEAHGAQLWDAIVSHRASCDVRAFALAAREISRVCVPGVRDRLEAAIDTLNIMHAAAAPSAQE